MYLRPASAAMVTACLSARSPRTRASFTSMGRFMPAMTSASTVFITEIARLEGVPPNMSVRITTPSPVLAAPTAAMISSRRASMSSSGPMQIVSTCSCGPTTCSSADLNSTARAPCVTRTRPIIDYPLTGPLRTNTTSVYNDDPMPKAGGISPLDSIVSSGFFDAGLARPKCPQSLTDQQHLMAAVDLAGARHGATRDADALDIGDERIFLDHALEAIDHIDHEVERRLGDERPADDA